MSARDLTVAEAHERVCRAGGFRAIDGRRLFEIKGADAIGWLHNLVTNTIKTLQPGEGNYAFAVNVQGRTLFDLNVLILPEAVWIDLDARWADDAVAHLNKYIVVEDVVIREITDGWMRFEVLGAATGRLVERLGLGAHFDVMADLQHTVGEVSGAAVRMVKDRLGPIPRAEFLVESSGGGSFSEALAKGASSLEMAPVDDSLAEMIRIEAGVPRSVDDIDHAVIPPETLQVERGISYVKGCYLGQEVIERMRSRGSMARRLSGLHVSGREVPPHNTPVYAGDKEIGRITSACTSVALDGVLAMGYVKTDAARSATSLAARLDEQRSTAVELVDLPLAVWRG